MLKYAIELDFAVLHSMAFNHRTICARSMYSDMPKNVSACIMFEWYLEFPIMPAETPVTRIPNHGWLVCYNMDDIAGGGFGFVKISI